MAEQWITIARASDKKVFDFLQDGLKSFSGSSATVGLVGIEQGFNLRDPDHQSLLELALSQTTPQIRLATFNFEGTSVQYFRGTSQAEARPTNAIFDQIKITTRNQQGQDFKEAIRLANFVQSSFDSIGPGSGKQEDGEVDAEIRALHHSLLEKLEAAATTQLQLNQKHAAEIDELLARRLTELDERLRTERARLEEEYLNKENALRLREDDLEQRKKTLDDRDHTHARRELRRDLQKIAEQRSENFRLTSGTRQLRLPIHATLIALIIVLGAINVLFFYNVNYEALLIPTLVKQTLLAATLLATTFFYVRWMNRWFEEHSTAEFLLKQFQLDIDRASWVVETSLEWRRDQKSEIPSYLLEGIARNLFNFDRKEGATERATAIDDLASALVGNASNVRLKAGENEISIDRRGLNRLAKSEG